MAYSMELDVALYFEVIFLQEVFTSRTTFMLPGQGHAGVILVLVGALGVMP